MSVDTFGHYSGALVANVQRGLPGERLKLTDDRNYNISNKRLCNVSDPEADDEAVNVKYMKRNSITLTKGKYNDEKKKISYLAYPADPADAVNKKYFDNTTKTAIKTQIPVKVETVLRTCLKIIALQKSLSRQANRMP